MNDLDRHCSRLLAILSDGMARSHEVLQAHLGASVRDLREALAKLEEAGLELTSQPDGRVRLASPFAVLDAGEILQSLFALGRSAQVKVVPIIDSTNAALMRRARAAGATAPATGLAVLAAELQTAGRGRQGRSWSAQAGSSLAVSFSQNLPRGLAELSGLSLMCGLAVRDALLRNGLPIQLKWPNDLLWQGQKLGGILIEVHPVSVGASVVVIGVGLNIRPDTAREAALAGRGPSALAAFDLASAGANVDRNRLVADLTDCVALRLEQFVTAGFAPHIADWNDHHAYRDRAVDMLEDGVVVQSGIARGVDEQGRLALDTEEGSLFVVAGDVSLRPRTIA